MKLVVIIVLFLLAAALVAYCVLVPKNSFIFFPRADGGSVVLLRWRIEFEKPPDKYTAGAFDHIDSYVSRLMTAPREGHSVMIFTPAGDRGFALYARQGVVEAHLSVAWRQEPQREAAIRAFFEARGIAPTEDYLAGNGGVPDATRLLAYPLSGGPSEVTATTKRILQNLCSITSTDPLNIRYSER